MPVVVVCTHCEAKMKVSDTVIGKKIRCKSCEGVFTAKGGKVEKEAVSAKPKKKEAPAKPESEPEGKTKDKELYGLDDLQADNNPYLVNKDGEGDLPRCPFCAKELSAENARICLNCGYDTVTRLRNQTKAVYQPTAMEWFMRLLPGIACVLAIGGLITGCIFMILRLSSWIRGSWFDWFEQEETFSRPLSEAKYNIPPGIVSGWSSVFAAFICWKLGKFAYKRLFIEYRPIEKKIEAER